jgi:hypothetical protein
MAYEPQKDIEMAAKRQRQKRSSRQLSRTETMKAADPRQPCENYSHSTERQTPHLATLETLAHYASRD